MNEKSEAALEAFNEFGDDVLRAAYACAGSISEAEDIAQEVFLKLLVYEVEFNDREHLRAWLIRAAINMGKNYRKSFRVSRTDFIDDIGENNLRCEFSPEEDDLRRQIAKLPPKYGAVLFLYYYEGYNIREIAETLGKNQNSVSSLLQRGRAKLRDELVKEGLYET